MSMATDLLQANGHSLVSDELAKINVALDT